MAKIVDYMCDSVKLSMKETQYSDTDAFVLTVQNMEIIVVNWRWLVSNVVSYLVDNAKCWPCT